MMSLKRRLSRLEEAFGADDVDLLHLILASYSADYSAWLADEVGAGRLQHGQVSRLVLEAGGRYSPAELDALMADMNRPAATPKPYRQPPDVAPSAPLGYRLGPPLPIPPALEPVTASPPEPELPEHPARIVRFIRSTDPEWGGEHNPPDDYLS